MAYTHIEDGFVRPLGPYIAQEILDNAAVRRIQKDKLYLESVSFRQGANQVGIDDLDNGNFGDGSPVLFRAILTIADKRWISETGRHYIQSDINLRFGASFLKLDDCVKKYKIKLLIQDSIVTLPRYMISTADLRIFVFRKDHEATYEYPIKSLNVLGYNRSRKFLSKYRALGMIETIVAANSSLPKSKRTPLEGRTPKWLVDQYLALYKQRFEEARVDPSLTPRHVHRSEVYAVFGRHATWLGETIKKRNFLNFEAWNRFSLEVTSRWERLQASEEEDQLQDWDELENLWDVPQGSRSPTAESTMDIDNAPVDTEFTDELEYVSTCSSDGGPREPQSRSISPEPGFAQASAGAKGNIEHENASNIADPDVLAAIPTSFFSEQPVLQSNMMWFCPDPKCSYSINFLDIPRDVLECLDQTSNIYLKSRKWNINDEEFIELFYDIVERHYFCHLDETGIKVVGFCSGEVDIFDRPILQERHVTEPRQLHANDHPKFKWIKPHNHLPAFSHLHI